MQATTKGSDYTALLLLTDFCQPVRLSYLLLLT